MTLVNCMAEIAWRRIQKESFIPFGKRREKETNCRDCTTEQASKAHTESWEAATYFPSIMSLFFASIEDGMEFIKVV